MARKFIPNGDLDFGQMAEIFANSVARSPGRFGISDEESAELSDAVAKFRAALQARCNAVSSAVSAVAKEQARAAAEKIIRRLANRVRADESISAVDKLALGIRDRSTATTKTQSVPNEPPRLEFVRAIHDNGAVPVHELRFSSIDFKRARPDGAMRIELFADLIPVDQPIPNYPGATKQSRPMYLRSFTKSPITLTPPMARVPMRVVYWARWADSQGNVGPFSATAVGWTEGGSHHLMTAPLQRSKMPQLIDVSEDVELSDAETTMYIALWEARQAVLTPNLVMREIPSSKKAAKQIEGPAAAEAARKLLSDPDHAAAREILAAMQTSATQPAK